MAKIIIGSKLPYGLILEHPKDKTKTITIDGLNSSKIIGATHMCTEVDGDFWAAWMAENKQFSAVVSGAIFEAKTVSDANAIAREQKDRKTGLEPMKPDAMGVKPADKE
jgi:hypothetical protein